MAQPLNRRAGPPATELIEEATQLLRAAPGSVWAAYAVGTIPFILAFLFYWADMSRSPAAAGHLLAASLGVSLLYVWMSCWQAVFVQALLAGIAGQPPAPWRLERITRLILVQGTWQPSGLLVLPLAALIAAPFGWIYAFYQNLTVFEGSPREAARRAREQAALWPWQNHLMLGALSVFGLFVFLNLLVVFLIAPILLRMFTGIEMEGASQVSSRFNTTTIAAISCLTYLGVDPLCKACYVLRCFYGEATHSGADLRAALQRLARVAMLAISLVLVYPGFCQSTAPRQESAVSPQELDRTLDRVIHQREFAWRMPRDRQALQEQNKVGNFFVRIADAIFQGIRRFLRALGQWVRDMLQALMPTETSSLPHAPLPARGLQKLLYVLSAVFAVILLTLWWRLRGTRKPPVVAATAAPVSVDLNDEGIAADVLPESGWLALAEDWVSRHDLRMALRALYLASLAHLAARQLITIHPAKSNADYAAELRRRSRAIPEVGQTFHRNLRVFERSWYGEHEVTPDLLGEFRTNFDRLRTYHAS